MSTSSQGPASASSNQRKSINAKLPPLCSGDPQSVIWRYLADSAKGLSARESLFIWVMGLPEAASIRDAAKNVLATYHEWFGDQDAEGRDEMALLLEQVVHSPLPSPRRRNPQRWATATYH